MLKAGGKMVSNCLRSYQNGEMGSTGPTIELFETAEDWHGYEYDSVLLRAVEEIYVEIFQEIFANNRVKLSVFHVTNGRTSRWFQERGFPYLDGMGEGLGEYLKDPEENDDYDDDDDDDGEEEEEE
mmetsp:Transcript_18052/g.45662  ORF Transcript_18052/g.45662 Transcript_18052/m.45662 type:complete len:126 (+) Transcript_18052:214-591(+)